MPKYTKNKKYNRKKKDLKAIAEILFPKEEQLQLSPMQTAENRPLSDGEKIAHIIYGETKKPKAKKPQNLTMEDEHIQNKYAENSRRGLEYNGTIQFHNGKMKAIPNLEEATPKEQKNNNKTDAQIDEYNKIKSKKREEAFNIIDKITKSGEAAAAANTMSEALSLNPFGSFRKTSKKPAQYIGNHFGSNTADEQITDIETIPSEEEIMDEWKKVNKTMKEYYLDILKKKKKYEN